MRTIPRPQDILSASRAGLQRRVPAGIRAAFFVPFILGALFLLTSCISGLPTPALSSLPPVETAPPAKYTKGSPSYVMLFHTMTSSMSSSGSVPSVAGVMGGLLGAGDSRMVNLRMVSHPGPAVGAPRAHHMIPPGMNMGQYLPLLPPEKEKPAQHEARPGRGGEEKPERMVIRIYWGCGEKVRQGQPRIIDTARMKGRSMPALIMGAASQGAGGERFRRGGAGALKPGWVEVLWPNREDSRQVPSSASLAGGHFIHGNFLPHIRFTMDAGHDIMEKLALNAEKTSLKDAVPITWKKIPTAIGYHLMAFAYSDARKEIVIWTSSENPDVNVGGEFLDTPVVKKHIAAKVIMPADRDRCVIPGGIFDGMDMVVLTGTAWGDDYWASEPPRPVRPPKNWKPDWVVKGQFLSTGSLMLGMSNAGSGSGGVTNIFRSLF